MNLLERARGIAGNILSWKVEPVDDAIRRFHHDYNTADEEFHAANARVHNYLQTYEGSIDVELPEPLEEKLDSAEDRYRQMRLLAVRGQRPRNVEVVIFTRHFNLTKPYQLKQLP